MNINSKTAISKLQIKQVSFWKNVNVLFHYRLVNFNQMYPYELLGNCTSHGDRVCLQHTQFLKLGSLGSTSSIASYLTVKPILHHFLSFFHIFLLSDTPSFSLSPSFAHMHTCVRACVCVCVCLCVRCTHIYPLTEYIEFRENATLILKIILFSKDINTICRPIIIINFNTK